MSKASGPRGRLRALRSGDPGPADTPWRTPIDRERSGHPAAARTLRGRGDVRPRRQGFHPLRAGRARRRPALRLRQGGAPAPRAHGRPHHRDRPRRRPAADRRAARPSRCSGPCPGRRSSWSLPLDGREAMVLNGRALQPRCVAAFGAGAGYEAASPRDCAWATVVLPAATAGRPAGPPAPAAGTPPRRPRAAARLPRRLGARRSARARRLRGGGAGSRRLRGGGGPAGAALRGARDGRRAAGVARRRPRAGPDAAGPHGAPPARAPGRRPRDRGAGPDRRAWRSCPGRSASRNGRCGRPSPASSA